MLRITLGAALALLTIASASAAAQATRPDRLRLDVYAGAFSDSYDISPDGRNTGLQLGLRLGYGLGERSRLIAQAAFAQSRNVSDPNGLPSYHVYDNVWALTTAGAEHDLVTGSTTLSLGLQAGIGWRRIDLAGAVGSPGPDAEVYGGGFSPMEVVAAGVTLRRRVSARTALLLSLQDQIFDVLEGPAGHSPSLVAGLSVR